MPGMRVPGVIISQHSGEGKANQYYVRGFNIDHGTDLALSVAGIPVNLPTNGHGQGYADLNFVIPELVGAIQYKKGTYFAEEGDFSAAGAIHMNYLNVLDRPIAKVEAGGYGYRRALVAASPRLGGGNLLAALEVGQAELPVLLGLVDAVEEALALLLLREVQEELDDARAIAMEVVLVLDDGPIAPSPRRRSEQVAQGATDDQVLLDLPQVRPRRFRTPRLQEGGGNHSAISTASLISSLHLGFRSPACAKAFTSGLTAGSSGSAVLARFTKACSASAWRACPARSSR